MISANRTLAAALVKCLKVWRLRRPWSWTSTACFLVAAFGWGASASATTRPTVIPLDLYLEQLLSFSADVNGRAERFLFDTGGGETVISPEFAKRLGCQPWGRLTGFQMRGERLDLSRCENVKISMSGVNLTAPTVGVFDITKGAPKDAPALAGSAALDMFARKVVTLDVAHQSLVIETPASLKVRIKGATELPMRFDRDVGGLAMTPTVALETPQGRVWLEIDCGSDGDVIVNKPLATALGLDPEKKGRQALSMKFAGGLVVETAAHVEDLIIDGNIGIRVLKRWVITMDTVHQRLWVAPATI